MKLLIKLIIYPMLVLLFISIIAFILMAGGVTFKGIMVLTKGNAITELNSGAGVYFLRAMNLIFGAIVSTILMTGIMSLFNILDKKHLESLPEWLRITEFKHLKVVFWETILLAMVVYFLVMLFESQGTFQWEYLILPGSILLISGGLYFVKKK